MVLLLREGVGHGLSPDRVADHFHRRLEGRRSVDHLPIERDASVLLAKEGEQFIVEVDISSHIQDVVVAAHALVDCLKTEDVVLLLVAHVDPACQERADDKGSLHIISWLHELKFVVAHDQQQQVESKSDQGMRLSAGLRHQLVGLLHDRLPAVVPRSLVGLY